MEKGTFHDEIYVRALKLEKEDKHPLLPYRSVIIHCEFAIVCADAVAVVRKLAGAAIHLPSQTFETFHLARETISAQEFRVLQHCVQMERSIQQKIIDKGKGNNPIVCFTQPTAAGRNGERESERAKQNPTALTGFRLPVWP